MQLSTRLPFSQMITRWASILNPVLANPMLSGNQIDNIVLVANTPLQINHKLSRLPQGWFVVDNIANTAVWRTQSFNPNTITLEASANTTISLWIY